MTIDKTDLQVIEMLKKDGSRTNKSIAEELGTSEETARRRIRNMRDNGVFQPTIQVDYSKLGYEVQAITRIQSSGIQSLELARNLALLDEVVTSIATVEGQVVIHSVHKDVADYRQFLLTLGSGGGIDGLDSSICTGVYRGQA